MTSPIRHRQPAAARPVARAPAALALMLLAALPAAGQPAGPKVTIKGGVKPDGSGYEWLVTNKSDSPVVSIEFPHYHADLFFAPDNWKRQSTNLVGIGDPDKPGTCTATVDHPGQGIAKYGTAQFGVRLCPAGARIGTGEVRVSFADGSTFTVGGVQLPVATPAIEGYSGMLGFLIVAVLIVAFEVLRRRRAARRAKAPTAPG